MKKTICRKVARAPRVIVPWITPIPPNRRASAVPRPQSESIIGQNIDAWMALRTAWVYIAWVRWEKSSAFWSSRTIDLLVLTPRMPSLNAAVVWELALRRAREVLSRRTWKYRLMMMSSGAMVITTRASRHASHIIKTTVPPTAQVPHVRSSIDQAMMRERLEQSLVSLAISQPTALRS